MSKYDVEYRFNQLDDILDTEEEGGFKLKVDGFITESKWLNISRRELHLIASILLNSDTYEG